jgi:hypothetical protein
VRLPFDFFEKKKGIGILESALKASPSAVVVAEPLLFNLCKSTCIIRSTISSSKGCFSATLYELRANVGLEKKKELLITVAEWSGDGLRTNCLKMPVN